MNNILPLRKKPSRLMECYRARMFRETTERLRAEVAAKEMRDLNENARALRAREVTDAPSLMDRLRVAKASPQEAPGRAEGFDRDFVARETAALAGGAAIEQEPSSDAPSEDDTGSGDQASPHDPAADQSTVGVEEAGIEAPDGQVAPASIDLSAADLAWLKLVTKMLWAATGVGEQDVLKAQFAAVRDHQTPADIGKAARERGMSIFNRCKAVCFGEADASTVLVEIAAIAGCETREIV